MGILGTNETFENFRLVYSFYPIIGEVWKLIMTTLIQEKMNSRENEFTRNVLQFLRIVLPTRSLHTKQMCYGSTSKEVRSSLHNKCATDRPPRGYDLVGHRKSTVCNCSNWWPLTLSELKKDDRRSAESCEWMIVCRELRKDDCLQRVATGWLCAENYV